MDNLIFGTASITSVREYSRAIELLDLAYDLGIRHFDTAPLYGKGFSEVILGKFIKYKRLDICVSTKFGLGGTWLPSFLPVKLALALKNSYNQESSLSENVPNRLPVYKELNNNWITRRQVKKSLENSLKRLGTDYIDYYFLHEGNFSSLSEGAVDFLQQKKQEGLILNIGLASNVNSILEQSKSGLDFWDTLQYEWESKTGSSKYLLEMFPNKAHFHHSCLRNWRDFDFPEIADEDKGGYLLARCKAINPHGKLIFSTTSKTRLKNNIISMKKFDIK